LNFSLPNELPAPPHTVDATPIPSPQSNPDALPIGAKIGIGLVVGITVMGLIGIAIYYWRRRSGRKEPISELHGQYVLENVHELASPHVVPELDDKAQIVAELPAEIWNMNPETSSLKELDTNERLDVIKTDARSRRKSDEIRLMRKHEQNMIRVENERENTQSPINKLAKENKMDNGLDDGVHRPSDHVPQPTSPEDFGLHQILEGREVERPAEENYLERVITSETPHRSQPSESTITGGSRSPVSPVSFA
jgi:hypothetical protein